MIFLKVSMNAYLTPQLICVLLFIWHHFKVKSSTAFNAQQCVRLFDCLTIYQHFSCLVLCVREGTEAIESLCGLQRRCSTDFFISEYYQQVLSGGRRCLSQRRRRGVRIWDVGNRESTAPALCTLIKCNEGRKFN